MIAARFVSRLNDAFVKARDLQPQIEKAERDINVLEQEIRDLEARVEEAEDRHRSEFDRQFGELQLKHERALADLRRHIEPVYKIAKRGNPTLLCTRCKKPGAIHKRCVACMLESASKNLVLEGGDLRPENLVDRSQAVDGTDNPQRISRNG